MQVLGAFSCDFWEIFKCSFFTEHPYTTASKETYFIRVLFLKNCKKTIYLTYLTFVELSSKFSSWAYLFILVF